MVVDRRVGLDGEDGWDSGFVGPFFSLGNLLGRRKSGCVFFTFSIWYRIKDLVRVRLRKRGKDDGIKSGGSRGQTCRYCED